MAHLLTVPERRLATISSTATSQVGRAGLVEELRRIPGAPDPVLLETLPKGVAFHHAGAALCCLRIGCLQFPRMPAAVKPPACWPCLSPYWAGPLLSAFYCTLIASCVRTAHYHPCSVGSIAYKHMNRHQPCQVRHPLRFAITA